MAEKIENKAEKAGTEGKGKRYNPKTAADVLKPHADNVAAEDAKMAADAGVLAAAYVDYDEALNNYQERSDVETLANRRAREVGAAFSDNDHHRELTDVTPEPEGTGADEKITTVPPKQVEGKK